LLVPLSALISAFALSILFTAPGNGWLMLLAAWLSISSKYLLTWQGRHVFNPTNFGLVMILLLSGQRAAIAPAYQWGGSTQIVLLVLGLGLLIMVWVRRAPLVVSFWAVFALGALLRSVLTHLPVSFTLLASLSGGAFMLFSFYMITDPKTSPSTTKGMIAFGALIGTVDLIFQLMTTVFSFIYALFAVSAVRWLVLVLASRRTALSHPSSVPMMPGSVGT
ncbi:MAG TPA: RnfABCDGE type electron transport complex subunit D, partial [Rhodothermales bacterium]